jgi:hypothetical protein
MIIRLSSGLPDALRFSDLHNISQFIEFADHGRPNKAFAPHPAILTDYPSPCVALSIVKRTSDVINSASN